MICLVMMLYQQNWSFPPDDCTILGVSAGRVSHNGQAKIINCGELHMHDA